MGPVCRGLILLYQYKTQRRVPSWVQPSGRGLKEGGLKTPVLLCSRPDSSLQAQKWAKMAKNGHFLGKIGTKMGQKWPIYGVFSSKNPHLWGFFVKMAKNPQKPPKTPKNPQKPPKKGGYPPQKGGVRPPPSGRGGPGTHFLLA